MIKTTYQFVCDYCGAADEKQDYISAAGVATPVPHSGSYIVFGYAHLCPSCADRAREVLKETQGDAR